MRFDQHGIRWVLVVVSVAGLWACGASDDDLMWALTGKQATGIDDVLETGSDVPMDPGVKDDGITDPGVSDEVTTDPGPGDLYVVEAETDACATDCTGKECGDDGCGGSCGSCSEDEECKEGQCACIDVCSPKEKIECLDQNHYQTCNDWDSDGCQEWSGPSECTGGDICKEGLGCECIDDCTDKECGDDGCGGSCGECTAYPNSFCNESGQCDCTMDTCLSLSKKCGGPYDDGCGSTVTCPACNNCGEECELGSCVFTACDGKTCGDDGCGGSCGMCAGSSCAGLTWTAAKTCVSGACTGGGGTQNCDDGEVCTTDACNPVTGCGHANNTVPCAASKCESGKYYAAANCSGGTCPSQTGVTCDDGKTCTTDTCTAGTGCSNTLQGGYCLIGGTCYADGQANPANFCEMCTSTSSQTSWSKSNGQPETCNNKDDDCNGVTDEDLTDVQDSTCLKKGVCLTGIDKIKAMCQAGKWFCDYTEVPGYQTTFENNCDGLDNDCDGLTDEATDAYCDDGLPCTEDVCQGGSCVNPLVQGNCLIVGTCYADGQTKTGDACQVCTSTKSTTAWSNATDGTGCAGGTCEGGTCVSSTVTAGFVKVDPGSFWMGSPDGTCPTGYPGSCTSELGRYSNETLHYVKLTHAFEMQAHEVTQGEFTLVMGWNPSYFGPNGSGSSCGTTCPVETVSWYDAVAYANQKSKAASLTLCYMFADVTCVDGSTHGSDAMACMNTTRKGIDSATVTLNGVSTPYDCTGYRLPTESEWEYAARAGSATAFYPSPGNNGAITYTDCTLDANLTQIGWYCGNDNTTTKLVGGKEANAWGLFDMSGNVWEWAWDGWGSYPGGTLSSPSEDPVGAATGSYRVGRGGGWGDVARGCRSAYRGNYGSPGNRGNSLGLRLARSM